MGGHTSSRCVVAAKKWWRRGVWTQNGSLGPMAAPPGSRKPPERMSSAKLAAMAESAAARSSTHTPPGLLPTRKSGTVSRNGRESS